jgi:hypothetical protein
MRTDSPATENQPQKDRFAGDGKFTAKGQIRRRRKINGKRTDSPATEN